MSLEDRLKAGKPLTVRDVERMLLELGFRLSHIRGSHHYWVRRGEMFIVPVHGKELKRWVTRELRKIYEKQNERKP